MNDLVPEITGYLNQTMMDLESDREVADATHSDPDRKSRLEKLDFGKICFNNILSPLNVLSREVRTILRSFPELRDKDVMVYNTPFSEDRVAKWMDYNPDRLLRSGSIYSHSVAKSDLRRGLGRPTMMTSSLWRVADRVYYIDMPPHIEQKYYLSGLVFEGTGWSSEDVYGVARDFVDELLEADERHLSELDKACDPFDGLILDSVLKDDIRTDLDRFMKSKEEYQQLGIPWKRGYMFIGPPGTGKTKCLRMISRHYNLTPVDSRRCLRNSGELDFNFTSDHSKMDRLLHPGKSKPTMIILEDIDKFVTYQSDGKERDAGSVTLHDMLKALDGFFEVHDMLFVATTNYPNQMSEALINRPGRFDRIWNFKMPGKAQIAQFLEYHGMAVTDAPLDTVVARLDGYSMAFAEEFVKSMKSIYHRASFARSEADAVLNRIAEHNEFCTKIFGKNKGSIGFGGG